jgi:hypothetical protein
MRRRVAASAMAATACLILTVPMTASAHPDHDRNGSTKEQFPGEGVVYDKQHDGAGGHLPATKKNVDLVGKAEVTNPSGAGNTGRVADVFAWGNYAYLNAFREPTCAAGGVHTMDIKDLANPKEIKEAFIPTSPGEYAGEGIQVIRYPKQGAGSFAGDVLIHQNETCDPALSQEGKVGGISLWNVTNPRKPTPIKLHAGDYTAEDGTAEPNANTVHSMFAWRNDFTKKTYVVLVDNEEFTDVDIMDITDPRAPVLVNDTLDLVELFGVDQEEPPGLTSVFSHDMMVYKHGSRYVMTMSYWDGGYVLLDVTNPAAGAVTLIADQDYAPLDEERLARGQRISPEGNAHQNELSPDHKFMIATDEDFDAYRTQGTIGSGPHAGATYALASGSGTPPVTPENTITGPTTFVGQACEALPAGTGIALVERGTCAFQVKLDNITAAGYSAGIVFNNADGCSGLVSMLAEGTIPFVFTTRTAGLQLLGAADTSCAAATPAPGTASATTTVSAVFDGWGYVRLFRTDIPKSGAGSIKQVDTYAIPESQDEAFAEGFGDLSVHEVAMDPRQGLAYLSYYTGGLRVVKYGAKGITEVGRFIDEGGNNFWGVQVLQRGGKTYVLASDRDYGLYIFKYNPSGGPL